MPPRQFTFGSDVTIRPSYSFDPMTAVTDATFRTTSRRGSTFVRKIFVPSGVQQRTRDELPPWASWSGRGGRSRRAVQVVIGQLEEIDGVPVPVALEPFGSQDRVLERDGER